MNATLQKEAVNTIALTPLKVLTAAVTLGITLMEMDLTAVVRIYSLSWIYTVATIALIIHVLSVHIISISIFIQTLMSVRVMT